MLKELAAEVSATAQANGFDAPTWDNFPIKVGMAITELDEAVMASKGRKVEKVHEELADASIRILGILHTLYGNEWSSLRVTTRQSQFSNGLLCESFEQAVWPAVRRLCEAMQEWRRGEAAEVREDCRVSLELALLNLFLLSDRLQFDMIDEIKKKNLKNKGRPHCHGNVRSEA